MDGSTVLWIVVGVIVVLIVLALLAGAAKKSKQHRNEQLAREHEQEARVASAHADKQQAAADEVDARARQAQAVADEKAAEARRLNAGATERQAAAEDARTQSAHHQEQADALHGGTTPSGEPRPESAIRDGRETTPHTATWGPDGDSRRPDASTQPTGSQPDGTQPTGTQPDGAQPVVDEQGDGCPADMNSEHFATANPGEQPPTESPEPTDQSPKHSARRR